MRNVFPSPVTWFVGTFHRRLAELPRSRFAATAPVVAAAILGLVLALMLYGLSLGGSSHSAATGQGGMVGASDLALYETIAARVAKGESYYAAATAEQRAGRYPLRPMVTVRLPTLAWIDAALGPTGARVLLALLTFAAWLAVTARLKSESGGAIPLYGSALTAFGLTPGLVPGCAYWHETWAMVLMVLALAVRTPGRVWASLVLALAAVAIREIAAPILLVMACAALLERRGREACLWAAGLALFASGMALHARALAPYVRPDDLHSPGWTSLGGWRAVVAMIHHSTSLVLVGSWATAIVLPLSLLGWAGWNGSFGLRTGLLYAGYLAGFTVFGRPDNAYWALLVAPLPLLGLARLPGPFRDLASALWRRHMARSEFVPQA